VDTVRRAVSVVVVGDPGGRFVSERPRFAAFAAAGADYYVGRGFEFGEADAGELRCERLGALGGAARAGVFEFEQARLVAHPGFAAEPRALLGGAALEEFCVAEAGSLALPEAFLGGRVFRAGGFAAPLSRLPLALQLAQVSRRDAVPVEG
jgi:hypothetical protein